ncbi:DUF2891 family protein [Saccharopolyspora phatthalungensis]|uniref:DUF2891 domain-containing protein n=1 Tax=Saccharopolyspora phatthalungensis TaxID=664693 RepID=A0A840QB91_9PSEU|nr:DUF2891 family protein [Saccharopolyspora phatthalungensis]MBB5159812.1 hypothetical protein [Saccharopolyspora phatthalungensis]
MIAEYTRAWSAIACEVLTRPYPYEAAHRSLDASDVAVTPDVLHPAFHGSFDWHSSVHMQWSLIRLLTLHPKAVDPLAVPLLNQRLAPDAIAAEVAYLRARPAFERPYGWAWATALMCAARDCPVPEARTWSSALEPLTETIADLTSAWLRRQALPARHGLQGNSAFALAIFLESFIRLGYSDLADDIRFKALEWFGSDTAIDTRFEPSGTDVFSPSLAEAELMRRVLAADDFRTWLEAFLPGLGEDRHLHLLDVPPVDDSGDGPLTHLSGLALSRAWQLRSLASCWPSDSLTGARLRAGAERQVAAVLPLLTGGDFMSTHWLVTFGILATAPHNSQVAASRLGVRRSR